MREHNLGWTEWGKLSQGYVSWDLKDKHGFPKERRGVWGSIGGSMKSLISSQEMGIIYIKKWKILWLQPHHRGEKKGTEDTIHAGSVDQGHWKQTSITLK